MRLLSSLLAAGLGASAASAALVRPAEEQQPLVDESSTFGSPSYRGGLLYLHKSLIETASQSGAEGDVGDWLVAYLREKRYRAVKQPVPGRDNTGASGRFNVIAWPVEEEISDVDDFPLSSLSSLSSLPPLLVTSHIDVVPPHIPYSIDDESPSSWTVIHGRGSVDAKGSVAAQITALEDLRSDGIVALGDALLVFVVGEEDSGDGMKTFSDFVTKHFSSGFKSAIFGEPTENKLACGHKGILGCTVTATGKAGHSGYPWLGKSANEALVRGLTAVLDADLGASPVFGNTTVNVGLIAGGVAANVIPAAAEALVAVRVAMGPQATGHEVVRERMQKALASVDADALRLSCSQGYGVVECKCAVDGFDTITVNYGTDVPNLKGDHTRYLYGPGDILVAHSDNEALTVGELETAVEGYKTLIRHALEK